jgi:type I site-specific restriction endonuclease
MIGRGTRLCPGLIDGDDKERFYIFDFCGVFDFFDEDEITPEGPAVAPTESELGLQELAKLERGDIFQIDGRGQKFHVFSSVGSYEKNVEKYKSKGRMFYHTEVVNVSPLAGRYIQSSCTGGPI